MANCQISLGAAGSTVSSYVNQDDIWPWPIYDLDTVEFESARSGLGGTIDPAMITRDCLGKKTGSGKMSLIALALTPSDISKIIGWADGGTELTLTIPKELISAGSDSSYSVKINNYPRGSHVGGGSARYDVPLSFIIVE